MARIKGTRLLTKTRAFLAPSGGRYLIHSGGTRSGKTYAILQSLVLYALENKCTVDIVRKELATAKKTVQLDLIQVLSSLSIYNEEMHNKTDAVFRLPTGSRIRLMGTDQAQKLRGAKRQILYINEANELSEESYKQLALRTTEKLIFDYNPSFSLEHHWLGDVDAEVIKSTYNDNPFLSQGTVREIENLIPVYREAGGTIINDEDLTYAGDGALIKGNPTDWAIYGKGHYKRSPLLLLPHYQQATKRIDKPDAYGIDFGYTAPTAVVKMRIEEKEDENNIAYVEEVLYQTEMTTGDLVKALPETDKPIYCDSAEPDRIDQLQRAGYDARKAKKDIEAGLDCLRDHQLFLSGQNLQAEVAGYQRKNRHTSTPADSPDHLCDAMRYVIFTHTTQPEDKGDINKTNSILSTLG